MSEKEADSTFAQLKRESFLVLGSAMNTLAAAVDTPDPHQPGVIHRHNKE